MTRSATNEGLCSQGFARTASRPDPYSVSHLTALRSSCDFDALFLLFRPRTSLTHFPHSLVSLHTIVLENSTGTVIIKPAASVSVVSLPHSVAKEHEPLLQQDVCQAHYV